MSFRRSVLGEIGTRDAQRLVGVDIGALVRRLLLFDRTIVKSFRLHEVPLLVRTFGKVGFSHLLDSGLLGFSCGFTTLGVDFSRGGIRPIPLDHFMFGIVSAANPDADLKAELRSLQSIPGLKNPERASLAETVWRSLVKQPATYGQELLDQVESDLRRNTPALKLALVERLKAELNGLPLPENVLIEVEETSQRVFHVKNTLSSAFGFSPDKTHLLLQQSVSAVANLNHRLADMSAYWAITGFRDSEAPLLFGKLSGILAPFNPQMSERQFERVIELANVPDFRLGQRVSVDLLLKARESPECREFREWLPTLEDASDAEIRDAITGIRNKMSALANSAGGKLVRLAATTGAGLIPGAGLVAGAVAGAIDSFLIDKVLPKSGIVAFLTDAYPSLFVSN
jgi:hypothetical protein